MNNSMSQMKAGYNLLHFMQIIKSAAYHTLGQLTVQTLIGKSLVSLACNILPMKC